MRGNNYLLKKCAKRYEEYDTGQSQTQTVIRQGHVQIQCKCDQLASLDITNQTYLKS